MKNAVSEKNTEKDSKKYVGRFAPSPTGPLHFGSLVTALASFLDARSKNGLWHLRIEDIDPPREPPEAKDDILFALDAHGLRWDGAVLYQSARTNIYIDFLQSLQDRSLTYPCDCPRKRLQGIAKHYDNRCRDLSRVQEPSATRVIADQKVCWDDGVQGNTCFDLSKDGDFIVRRKNGFFSYQLAVSVDDVLQKITTVVRGVDLMETTGRQIFLMQCFDQPPPCYAHIGVVLGDEGNKLSKQSFAPPIQSGTNDVRSNLVKGLQFLQQNPPQDLFFTSVDEILSWAVENWHLDARVGKSGQFTEEGFKV